MIKTHSLFYTENYVNGIAKGIQKEIVLLEISMIYLFTVVVFYFRLYKDDFYKMFIFNLSLCISINIKINWIYSNFTSPNYFSQYIFAMGSKKTLTLKYNTAINKVKLLRDHM